MNKTKEITFKNKPNLEVTTSEGHKIWYSRSVAVNGVIFAKNEHDEMLVLALQRAANMDEGGKWCIPCGYLDWNETGFEAVTREVYEETGLYLPEYEIFNNYDKSRKEYYVNTNPSSNKENVSLYYLFMFRFEAGLPRDFQFINPVHKHEIIGYEWVNVDNLFNNATGLDWAFNHDERIKDAYYAYISS